MTMRTHDYLERPPLMEPERQATPNDNTFALHSMMEHYLKEIRNELCKTNPDVMCQTVVQGGPIINDTKSHTVWFEVGGKRVTVYKTLMWSVSGLVVNASVTSMSNADDGFTIPSNPLHASSNVLQLNVPIFELAIATPSGTIGVNIPSNLSANRSVFIYGFTIPDQLQYQEPY